MATPPVDPRAACIAMCAIKGLAGILYGCYDDDAKSYEACVRKKWKGSVREVVACILACMINSP